MRINKSSWHYRLYDWCSHFNGWNTPDQTNLCDYVGTMFSAIFKCLLLALVGIALLVAIFFIGQAAYHHYIIALCILAAVGFVFGAVWFLTSSDTAELIVDYVAAKKQGICPVVEFVEGDNNDHQ